MYNYLYASTDKNGNYVFEGLAPGKYELEIKDSDYSSKFVMVDEGETVICDFGKDDATIYGVITVEGSPLANCRLTLVDTNDPAARNINYLKFVETGEDGNYRIQGIPGGTWYLSIRQREIGKPSVRVLKQVEVSAGQNLEYNFDIRLGVIKGRVVMHDGSQSTIRNLRISLIPPTILDIAHDQWNVRWQMGTLKGGDYDESNGNFEIKDVAAGHYVLMARSLQYGTVFKDITIKDGEILDDIVVTMPPSGKLDLRLVDNESGSDIQFEVCHLILIDEKERFHIRDYLNRGDNYGKGICAGTYQVSFICDTKDGLWITPLTPGLVIQPDQTTEMTLNAVPAILVNIDVKNKKGQHVDDFTFNTFDKDGNWIPHSGKFRDSIEGILPIGPVRFVIKRHDNVVFDKIINVAPPKGSGKYFDSVITINEQQ
jgi:hypothetical protein